MCLKATRFLFPLERNTLYLLGGVLLLRIIFLAVCGLDLSADESYYWTWSRFPDWCYYSKPPGISWINGVSTALFGINDIAVRLPAVMFGTLGLWMLYLTARHLYGKAAGVLALMLSLATPANAALNLLMTIDSPLALGWLTALYGLSVAFFPSAAEPELPESQRREQSDLGWLLLGAGAFVATLSKQMGMVLLILPVIAWLVVKNRPQRVVPGMLKGAVGGLMALMPVLIWNASNGWITAVHTREHFQDKPFVLGDRVVDFLSFVGSQAGLMGPLLFAACAAALFKAVRNWRDIGDRERFLLVLGPVHLLIFYGLALKQRVQPNWPLVYYLPFIPLVAGWLSSAIPLPAFRNSWFVRQQKPLLYSGFALVGLFYLVPLLLPATGNDHLLGRLRGWKDVAAEVQEVRETHKDLSSAPILFFGRRQPVSALWFYLPDNPRIYLWSTRETLNNQYAFWSPPECGKEAYLVLTETGSLPLSEDFSKAFGALEHLKTFKVQVGSVERYSFEVYRGRNLESWPSVDALTR